MIKIKDINVKYQVLIKEADTDKVYEALYFESSTLAKQYADDFNHYQADLPVDMLDYPGGKFAVYNGAFPLD